MTIYENFPRKSTSALFTGEKAVQHWLDEATRAETQQERATALETAQTITKSLGLTLEHFLFRRAA